MEHSVSGTNINRNAEAQGLVGKQQGKGGAFRKRPVNVFRQEQAVYNLEIVYILVAVDAACVNNKIVASLELGGLVAQMMSGCAADYIHQFKEYMTVHRVVNGMNPDHIDNTVANIFLIDGDRFCVIYKITLLI